VAGPPWNGTAAIEARQTELRNQPQISVGRLDDGGDATFGKAVADLPRDVRELSDVERGDCGIRAETHRQQHSTWQNARRDNISFPFAGPFMPLSIVHRIISFLTFISSEVELGSELKDARIAIAGAGRHRFRAESRP
jgi:hypothetical protein